MVDEVSTVLRLSVCETLNQVVVVVSVLGLYNVAWYGMHSTCSIHHAAIRIDLSETRYRTLSDQGTHYVTSGILTTSEVVSLRGYDHEDVWSFIMY